MLTAVRSNRIVGVNPPNVGGATGLLDVQVTVGTGTVFLPRAFRYLPPTPGLANGDWRPAPDMPDALGEVACGVIGGKMYVVGEGSSTWRRSRRRLLQLGGRRGLLAPMTAGAPAPARDTVLKSRKCDLQVRFLWELRGSNLPRLPGALRGSTAGQAPRVLLRSRGRSSFHPYPERSNRRQIFSAFRPYTPA